VKDKLIVLHLNDNEAAFSFLSLLLLYVNDTLENVLFWLIEKIIPRHI